MRFSESLDKIAPAIIAAQTAMPAVHKTATNPAFKSKYATLDDVMSAALAAFGANGIAVLQSVTEADDTGFTMNTTLLHGSGQGVEGGVRIGVDKPTPQGWVTAVTYARRTSLGAVAAIVPDTDEDGNMPNESTPEAKVYQRPAVAPASPANASKPVKAPSGGVPKSCPNCGGKIWDNREKIASGQFKKTSPIWSCADDVCKKKPGSVGWPEKDAKTEFAAMPEALAAPLPGEPEWDE